MKHQDPPVAAAELVHHLSSGIKVYRARYMPAFKLVWVAAVDYLEIGEGVLECVYESV